MQQHEAASQWSKNKPPIPWQATVGHNDAKMGSSHPPTNLQSATQGENGPNRTIVSAKKPRRPKTRHCLDLEATCGDKNVKLVDVQQIIEFPTIFLFPRTIWQDETNLSHPTCDPMRLSRCRAVLYDARNGQQMFDVDTSFGTTSNLFGRKQVDPCV